MNKRRNPSTSRFDRLKTSSGSSRKWGLSLFLVMVIGGLVAGWMLGSGGMGLQNAWAADRSYSNRALFQESTSEPLAIFNQTGSGTLMEWWLSGSQIWRMDNDGDLVCAGSQTVDGKDVSALLGSTDINTFSKLNTIVADKTLVNEEDAATLDADWVNTANPWADNEVSDTLTVGASGSVNDSALSAYVAHLNVAETITENWVNTANPWADNEVSDTLTVGASGSVNDAAIPAGITRDEEWNSEAELEAALVDVTNVFTDNDYGVQTTVGDPGSDSNLVSEQAVREAIAANLHNAWMIADQYVESGTYPDDDDVMRYDFASKQWKFEAPPGAAGGEANTGSNVGGGAEVFKEKSGIDFVHRTLESLNNALVIYQQTNTLQLQMAWDRLYQAFLCKENVDVWSPDGDYEPATKKYVDDQVGDIPYVTSGDVTVAEGQIKQKSHEDAIAVHGGSSGEVQDEALISIQDPVAVHCDPGALYDNSTDWRFFSCGDTEPNGIVITEWKIDFGMNPDVELDADLCYADDWAGTNETVLDALDTTDGSASDDAVTLTVPAGKYLYVRMNADPEGTGDYLTFEFQYYKPED